MTGTLRAIDKALDLGPDGSLPEPADGDSPPEPEEVEAEGPAEDGAEEPSIRRSQTNLLDRLLYKGVLPRYAFPTDVVSFYVFDRDDSTRFRAEFQYEPSQGLDVALTQYAPGQGRLDRRQGVDLRRDLLAGPAGAVPGVAGPASCTSSARSATTPSRSPARTPAAVTFGTAPPAGQSRSSARP